MTRVRRQNHRGRLTFISEGWKVFCRQARLHIQRPGEDAGRSIPPQSGLDTYVFFGSELKSIVAAVAASISYGDFVAPQRRAHSEVILHMQPDTSSENALEAQQRPEPRLHPERGVLN
jgi:hypothetical protein